MKEEGDRENHTRVEGILECGGGGGDEESHDGYKMTET